MKKFYCVVIDLHQDDEAFRRRLVRLMTKSELREVLMACLGTYVPRGEFWKLEFPTKLLDSSGWLGDLFPKEIPATIEVESVKVEKTVLEYMRNRKVAWFFEYIKGAGIRHTIMTPVPPLKGIKKMLLMPVE